MELWNLSSMESRETTPVKQILVTMYLMNTSIKTKKCATKHMTKLQRQYFQKVNYISCCYAIYPHPQKLYISFYFSNQTNNNLIEEIVRFKKYFFKREIFFFYLKNTLFLGNRRELLIYVFYFKDYMYYFFNYNKNTRNICTTIFNCIDIHFDGKYLVFGVVETFI